MGTPISSKYEENKARLVEKIKRNEVDISFEKSGNNLCYFCSNKIINLMVKLTEKEDYDCKTFYFLDVNCYDSINPFEHNKM